MLHAAGLFVLLLATAVILPLPWVYAFYQNVTVLADPDLNGRRLTKQAWTQASLSPGSNHIMLGVLLLFGFFVFVNWMGVFAYAPALLKMFLGIETAFSRSPSAMINSTSLMAAFWMAYLCVDPILKAGYVLRCFYGEARHSGEDLKAGLRRSVVPARALALLLLTLIGIAGCRGAWVSIVRAQAQNEIPTTERSTIDPSVLDQKIDTVIHQPRYTWRMPRTAAPDAEVGLFRRFVMATIRFVRDVIKTVGEWIEKLLDWLFGGSGQRIKPSAFDTMARALPYLLLLLVAVVLVVIFLRLRRPKKQAPVAAAVLPATPDISNENVGADQLPEDGWTNLARQLLERGDYRLAIRAFYLATLAHLAQRNLVGIARFKSNRDYERELQRRAHAIPSLLTLFSENLFTFERTWYGMHDVNRELVQQFAATVDRIRNEA
jgi:hypothetical protein